MNENAMTTDDKGGAVQDAGDLSVEGVRQLVAQKYKRVLHKECYNGILQLRSSLCNTVQNVRQSGL